MARPALIKFPQDSSTAPTLSYNVPQSVALSGRHFIEINAPGMDQTWFNPIIGQPNAPNAQTRPALARMRPAATDLLTVAAAQNVTRVAQLIASPRDLVAGRVSKELLNLSTDDLKRMQASGKQPIFYRLPSGTMTFTVASIGDGGGKPPPIWSKFGIITPAWGSTLSGPATGITVSVTGVASPDNIEQVTVSLDDGPAVQASSSLPSGSLSQWFTNINVTTSGPHRLWAEVSFKGSWPPSTGSGYIDFTVTLAGGGDNVPVDLKIASPLNGATIWDPNAGNNFSIPFTGTCQPSGLASLQIFMDASTTPVLATPGAAGDYSTWSATVNIDKNAIGVHNFVVTAQSNAGTKASVPLSLTTLHQVGVTPGTPRLFLVESVSLTSFAGDYGAAQVLQSFSLFPGEQTKISVSSYTKTSDDINSSSSVLDSSNTTSESDFSNSVSDEQSNQQDYKNSLNWNVSLEGGFSYGVASAKITAGAAGATNSARQDIAKNAVNATQKHSESKSNARSMQVSTSQDTSVATGTQNSIERLIRNVNLSRTLNLVFRQMSQQFISLYHLTDVKIAYIRDDTLGGTPDPVYIETSLSQLRDFLTLWIDTTQHQNVIYEAIKGELNNVIDYDNVVHSFAEEVQQGGASYLRVRRPFISNFPDKKSGPFTVPGVILAVNYSVMKTEGVLVDAFLGQGDALDTYSMGLQDQKVETERVNNERAKTRNDRFNLANTIIRDGDVAKAAVYATIYGPHPHPSHKKCECESVVAKTSEPPVDEDVNDNESDDGNEDPSANETA